MLKNDIGCDEHHCCSLLGNLAKTCQPGFKFRANARNLFRVLPLELKFKSGNTLKKPFLAPVAADLALEGDMVALLCLIGHKRALLAYSLSPDSP